MAIHSPTSQVFPDGVVSITSLDSTSYESILESLGSTNYIMTGIYIQTFSVPQILENIGFYKYDSNGNIGIKQVVPAIDPNQDQLSLNIDFETKNYILDGKLYIDYALQPLETVNFYIENIIVANADLLTDPKNIENGFDDDSGFFDDYTDKIPLRLS